MAARAGSAGFAGEIAGQKPGELHLPGGLFEQGMELRGLRGAERHGHGSGREKCARGGRGALDEAALFQAEQQSGGFAVDDFERRGGRCRAGAKKFAMERGEPVPAGGGVAFHDDEQRGALRRVTFFAGGEGLRAVAGKFFLELEKDGLDVFAGAEAVDAEIDAGPGELAAGEIADFYLVGKTAGRMNLEVAENGMRRRAVFDPGRSSRARWRRRLISSSSVVRQSWAGGSLGAPAGAERGRAREDLVRADGFMRVRIWRQRSAAGQACG